jgi:hypothetical protein
MIRDATYDEQPPFAKTKPEQCWIFPLQKFSQFFLPCGNMRPKISAGGIRHGTGFWDSAKAPDREVFSETSPSAYPGGSAGRLSFMPAGVNRPRRRQGPA